MAPAPTGHPIAINSATVIRPSIGLDDLTSNTLTVVTITRMTTASGLVLFFLAISNFSDPARSLLMFEPVHPDGPIRPWQS